jgi:hypothetical protein
VSKQAPVFSALIDDANTLLLDDRTAFKAWTKTLIGQPVQVTVKRKQSQRSLDQNAYIWGVAYPIIAEELGIRFHSKKEAARYVELTLREKAGEIARLKRQQYFELRVPLTDLRGDVRDLRRVAVIGNYVADFTYDELTVEATRFVVEDVKGFRTPQYRWKKKHFEAQYGIEIREV